MFSYSAFDFAVKNIMTWKSAPFEFKRIRYIRKLCFHVCGQDIGTAGITLHQPQSDSRSIMNHHTIIFITKVTSYIPIYPPNISYSHHEWGLSCWVSSDRTWRRRRRGRSHVEWVFSRSPTEEVIIFPMTSPTPETHIKHLINATNITEENSRTSTRITVLVL